MLFWSTCCGFDLRAKSARRPSAAFRIFPMAFRTAYSLFFRIWPHLPGRHFPFPLFPCTYARENGKMGKCPSSSWPAAGPANYTPPWRVGRFSSDTQYLQILWKPLSLYLFLYLYLSLYLTLYLYLFLYLYLYLGDKITHHGRHCPPIEYLIASICA